LLEQAANVTTATAIAAAPFVNFHMFIRMSLSDPFGIGALIVRTGITVVYNSLNCYAAAVYARVAH